MGRISKRKSNRGLRKICECPRRTWAKCQHSWHFNFKPKGGPAYRFSVDSEAGTHIAAKTDAEALADTWRSAIRADTFRRRLAAPSVVEPSPDVMTLERFGAIYAERLGKPVSRNHHTCFQQFVAFAAPGTETRYGARPVAAFTEDDVEAFFAHLQDEGVANSTRNKYVQMVKALFRWGTRKGYVARDPAADSDVLTRRKHAQRERRLEPDEEARLLQHAGPHLQRLIIAALETACRKGELLSLTWRDVNLERREMTIRAERTKTKTVRVIPMSARLAGVLELSKTDPTGKDFTAEDFVFGDVVGRQVTDVKKAWETAVLKAQAHTPQWTRTNSLAPASREAFRGANLTFHDLRHEAGSRLLEAGWPLHSVSHMLGHANIAQTSTYLNATKVGLQDAMRRLDASRCNPVASETRIERAPTRNDDAENTTQGLVN
jgi:integrase